jgi:hypothetical protein
MRVYIAGRVTGLNYADVVMKFRHAENQLRDAGHHPINPLTHVNCLAKQRDAMKICVPLLLDADAVFLLPDWEFSEGAQIEVQLARYAGIHLINEEDLN